MSDLHLRYRQINRQSLTFFAAEAPKWQSLPDFFAMGGHATYVWSAYGLCFLLMVIELFLVIKRRRKALVQLKQFIRMKRVQDNESET